MGAETRTAAGTGRCRGGRLTAKLAQLRVGQFRGPSQAAAAQGGRFLRFARRTVPRFTRGISISSTSWSGHGSVGAGGRGEAGAAGRLGDVAAVHLPHERLEVRLERLASDATLSDPGALDDDQLASTIDALATELDASLATESDAAAAAAGSGVTGDLLAHCIDTALWLNGPIDRPWGIRTASFRDPGGHDIIGDRSYGSDPLHAALSGGDDYELLFTASPAEREPIGRASHSVDVPVTRIGRVVEGTGVKVFAPDGEAIDPEAGFVISQWPNRVGQLYIGYGLHPELADVPSRHLDEPGLLKG